MKQKLLIVLLSFSLTMSIYAQQAPATAFSYRVPVTDGWVFYGKQVPSIRVIAEKSNGTVHVVTVRLDITTDTHSPVGSLSQQVHLSQGDSTCLTFAFTPPAPGFYRLSLSECTKEGNIPVKTFNVGYEPTAIVSLPDTPPDFVSFWDQTKAELQQVAPEYKLEQLTSDTNIARKLYRVSMKSWGGVEISGYYSVPAQIKKGKKVPAIIYYMGYGSKPWIPGGNPGCAEFVLSTRGQGLQQPTNSYGDWITYKLDAKEAYYYRGAFMDLIRAVDFIASRPEIDASRIAAEGGSQGGAFTLIACALDHRLRVGAPTIPFLSDYRDYFNIVSWPGNVIKKRQQELGLSDEQLYLTLSYFDVKNFAGMIQCPIIMGVGLQDPVCPPHTNFAGFNRILAEKAYYIYPLNEHSTPPAWDEAKEAFYRKHGLFE
ncbi:MAG: acetylxylan esterase [Prevotellaceae bacterium]|jgi:cephalosporin-C deacetylase|nr:acetylxylan esterase [Prevotellaceae bacterium]